MEPQHSQPTPTPSALARQQRVTRRRRRDHRPWPWWAIDLLPAAGEGWPPATGRRFRTPRRASTRLAGLPLMVHLPETGGEHDGAA